jgi:O-antigen/teichoic acid export membrane protein
LKNLIKQISSLLVIRWSLIPLSFITGIFVARAIGPHGKGALTLLGSLVAMVAVIANLGLTSSSAYLYKQKKYSIGTLTGVAALLWVVVAGALVALLCWKSEEFIKIIAGDLRDSAIQPIWLWLSLATLPGSLFLPFVQTFLIIENQMRIYTLVNIGSQLVGVALAWTLVIVLKWGVTGALFANVGVQCIATVIAVYWLKSCGEQGRLHFSWSALTQMVRIGYGSYFTGIIASVFKRGEVLVLALLLDIEAVGYYGVALLFYDLVIDMPRAVVWPIVGRLADPDTADQANVASRSIRMQIVIMSGLVIAIALLSPFLVPLLYGRVFAPAGLLLAWIIPGVVFRSIHLGVFAYVTARGRAEATIPGVTAAAVVNLVLDLVLVPSLGLLGVAISNVVAEMLLAILSIIAFLKHSDGRLRDVFPPRRDDLRDLSRVFNAFVQKAREHADGSRLMKIL